MFPKSTSQGRSLSNVTAGAIEMSSPLGDDGLLIVEIGVPAWCLGLRTEEGRAQDERLCDGPSNRLRIERAPAMPRREWERDSV